MANNTELTASSREQIDKGFEALLQAATASSSNDTNSAVIYSPAEQLIDRYDVGETPVINTEANQSSSSEEPSSSTKLGTYEKPNTSLPFIGAPTVSLGNFIAQVGMHTIKGIQEGFAKDAAFDFVRSGVQNFIESNIGNILRDQKESDDLNFQKQYLQNYKDLNRTRNKLIQAVHSGNQDEIDQAYEEYSVYKSVDNQWRQDYLRMNDEKEDYNKYYRDEDIDKRINKINDRLAKLGEYINTDRDDMEFWQGLLNQVDSIYKPSDEWEDAKKKNWFYQIPAGIASSVPSMATNLAAYGAATLLGAAGSFAGPAGTAGGAYLGMSLMAGSTLLSRNQESLAEVSGAYKGKIYDFLNENQLPLSAITNSEVRQRLTALTGQDYSTVSDDKVLDAMLAYDIDTGIDELNIVAADAKNRLNDVYNRNMALVGVDLAQNFIMIPGAGKIIGKALQNSNIGEVGTNLIYKGLDKAVDYTMRKAGASAAKRAAASGAMKYVVEPIYRMGANALLEGGEEATQYMISRDPSDEDRDWYNPFDTVEMMAENSYAFVKGMAGVLGISGDPALNSDKELADNFKVGMAIGFLMGGPLNIRDGVRNYRGYTAGRDLARQMMAEQIQAKEDVYKYIKYGEKANMRMADRKAMLDGIDTQLNDDFLPEGWTREDLEKEKQNINDIYDIIENNSFIRQFNRADRPIAAALLKHNEDILDRMQSSYNSIRTPEFVNSVQNVVNKLIRNTEGLSEENATLLTNYFLNKYSQQAISSYLNKLKRANARHSTPEMMDLIDEMYLNQSSLQQEANYINESLKQAGIDKTVENKTLSGVVNKIKSTFLQTLIAGRALRKTRQDYSKLSSDKATMQAAIDKYKQSVIDNTEDNVQAVEPERTDDNTAATDTPEVVLSRDNEQIQNKPETENKSDNNTDDETTGTIPPATPQVPPVSPSPESQAKVPFDITNLPTYDPSEPYASDDDYTQDELTEEDFINEQQESNINNDSDNPTTSADEGASNESDESQSKPFDLTSFSTFDPNETGQAEQGEEQETETPRTMPTEAAPVNKPEIVDKGTSEEYKDKLVEGNQNLPTPQPDNNLTEGTLYYQNTDTPMFQGYESGSSFNTFSSTPGNISNSSITAQVADSNFKYGAYNPNDKKTWDNAAVYVTIQAPDGKQYITALKTIGGAKQLKLAHGQQLSPEEENGLRTLRNTIIEAKLRNPNATVTFNHVRMTNGQLNANRQTVTRDGQTYQAAVNRNLQEVKGLNLPSDLHGLLDTDIAFGIGEGYRNNFRLTVLNNDPGLKYNLEQNLNGQAIRGGYGNIFIIPSANSNPSGLQNSVIKLNEKRFADEDDALADLAAQAVLYSRTRDGYDTEALRKLLIFTDWEQISENDPRFDIMSDKQIKLFTQDQTPMLQLGTTIRPLAEYQNDQGLAEVTNFIKQNSHWSMDYEGLQTPMRDMFTSYFRSHYRNVDLNTIPDEIALAPGFKITLKDLGLQKVNDFRNPLQPIPGDNGYTGLEWLIKEGKLQSDLQDQIYTSPFIYVGEPVINDNPTQQEQQLKTATEDPINPEPKSAQPSKFKVGDRVSIWRSSGDIIGEVIRVHGNSTISVRMPDGQERIYDQNSLNPIRDQVQQSEQPTTSQEVQDQVDELFSGDGMNVDDLFKNLGAYKISNRAQLRHFKRINTVKAVKWLKRIFGLTDEQVIITDGIIRQFANGSAVYGVCNADCINISNMAVDGVQYHEAWHRVSLLMLTPEMRKNLYEEYRKQYPQYKNVSDQVLEEALADRFMEYMLNDKQSTLRYYINKIFRDILKFVGLNRKINPRNLNSIYQAIKYGDFRKHKLNDASVAEFKNAYINNEAYYKVGKDGIYQPNHFPTLSDFHTTMSSLRSCLLIANGVKFISDINNLNKGKLLDMLKGVVSSSKTTTQQKESIQEIIDNFDNWMYEMQPMLAQLGIRDIDNNEENDFLEREETGIQNYDKAAYEFSKKDNALGIVKLFLSTIPEYYYDYIDTPNGKNKLLKMRKDPITGLPRVYDYDTVATQALNKLGSIETYSPTPGDDPNKSLLGRCATLSRENAIFAALYHRLSSIKDSNLETQILQTVKSASLNPIEVSYFTDKNGVGQFKVTDSTIKSTIRMLPTAWSSIFFNSPLVKQSDTEIIVDKKVIREIVEEYDQLVKDVFKNSATMTDTDIDVYRNGIVALLNSVGIQVDNEAIEELLRGDRKRNLVQLVSRRRSSDVNTLSAIFDVILADIASDKPSRAIQLDQIYTRRRADHIINRIAYAQATAAPQNNELSVLGPNNNIFYLKTQNNYCSDLVRRLNEHDASTLTGINNDIYCNSSLIKAAVNNNQPIKLHTFINFYGNNSGDKGREYLQVSPTEDYLLKMSLTWNNFLIFPTMADKKTWNVISGCTLFNKPFNITQQEDGSLYIQFDQEVLDQMYGYWKDEFESIVQYWKSLPNVTTKIKNYHTKNFGGKFRHFKGYYEVVNGKRTYIDLNKNIDAAIKNGTVLEILEQIRQDLFTQDKIAYTEGRINNNLFLELQNELETAYNLGLINRDSTNPKKLSNKLMDSRVYEEVKSWYINSPNATIRANADRYAVMTMIGNHMLNANVSKLETEKIFTGDLAFYKNTDDQIKRLGAVLSTGDNMRTQWLTNNPQFIPEYRRLQARQTYTCAIFNDNMIASKQYDTLLNKFTYANVRNLLIEKEGLTEAQVDELMKNQEQAKEQYPFIFELAANLAKADADAYGLNDDGQGNINQADAAVYIRPQMYQDIIRMLGEWSDEVKEAYDILESAEDWLNDPILYQKSLKTLIKALKTTYFGYRYDNDLQHNVPVFNKMAMFPMFKVLANGDNLDIYERMNAVGKYAGLKPIDQIAFESAVKVGIEGGQNFYKDYNNEQINDLTNIHTTIQEFRNLRRQLITDPHTHERQLFGTQVSTVAVANLKMDRVYGEGKPEGMQRTGQQLKNQLFGTINAISNKGAEQMREMFLTDGELDWSKTSDVLVRAARSSNMGRDLEAALTVNEDKDGLTVPLAALPDSKWVETTLTSTANKKAVDIELPGGAFIQMSSFGFKKIGVESSRLLNIRDDGSMDCVISINLFRHIIPDFDKKSFTEAKQWLIAHNLIGDNAGPIAMGYRIPTQGLSSIAGLHIKDVLPSNVGDIIVLPDEFTTQTGSDFDIDKLYIARYNFDKEGNKIEFKGLQKDESFEDYLRRRYIEEEGGSFEGSERGQEATMRLFNNWLNRLGNPTNVYEANSREANENLLLDTYMLVLTDDKNITETRLPLDKVTGIIKNEILPVVDSNQKKGDEVPFLELSPTFQMNKKYEYSGGKTGIGPFALNNKNHVITQLTNLMFKDNSLLKSLGFTGLNGIKSQNETVYKRDKYGDVEYDDNGAPIMIQEEGLNILDWISAMINAHVDVAKDPYVIRLNVRQYTYNICNFLLRAGFGKNTFYFLPQPILKEMALAYERANGIYGVKGGSKTSIVNEEIRNIRKEYYRKYTEACAKSGVPVELDFNDKGTLIERNNNKVENYAPDMMHRDYLIDALLDTSAIDTADADIQAKYYRDQLRYSEIFLQLNTLAQDMSKLVQLSQIDTKRYGGNFVEQDRFMYRLKSFLNTTTLFNRADVEKYFAESFLLTKAINGMILPASIFQDTMFRSKQSFKDSVTKVLTLIRMDNVNDEALNKTISNELEGQIRWKFLNNIDGFNLYNMLYGKNSMAQRLANIKNDIIQGKYPELLTADGKIANKLLDHLTSLARFSTDAYNAPAIIATNRVNETDKFLKQDLKLYWEELLESPHEEIRNFANDLIDYQLATTAGNFTKNGIWNLLPVSAILNSGYASYIDNAVKNFTEADLNYNDLFLNNWNNSKIVPTIDTKIQQFDEEVGEVYDADRFPILYGDITINNSKIRVPVVLNPNRPTVGKNSLEQPLYTPYVKVVVDRTTPEGILLYKYVGTVLNNKGNETPLYVITYKKGLNQGGRVIKEYDGYSNSIFDFNNIKGAIPGNSAITIDSVINTIQALGDKTDTNRWITEIKESFTAVNDITPVTQALYTNLLTLGLDVQPTETYTEQTNQGDIVEVDQSEANVFTFKDGTKINIPFKLNEQQTKALLVLEDFVNNSKKYGNVITLCGYAGTGKSTLIGIFDKYLKSKYINPKYSAPTHRANAVTKMNNPEANVSTLHSLFGLTNVIDLTDGNYDLRKLKNQQRNRPKLKNGSVLIIDEASMISKGLFQFIEDYKNNHNVKIIYVGDDAQLAPVNDDTISPVFTGNYTKLQLTKVERTGDNAILAESTRLRNKQDFSYETRDNVEFTNSIDRANEVIDTIVNSDEFKTNPLYFRILSATNDMISDANNRVRRILFGDNPKQIEVGDVMMGYSNVLDPDMDGAQLIANSIDYVVSEVGEQQTKTVGLSKVKVKGYNVVLDEANARPEDNRKRTVFVLSNDTDNETLQKLSDDLKYINTQISQAFMDHNYDLANKLMQLKSQFEASTVLMRDYTGSNNRLLLHKALDYGYAHTIHKSQGGTYNNVLIYADTIDRFSDPLVKQQLKYVAMSRAKDNVTVLTSHAITSTKTVPEVVQQTHNETLQVLGGVSDQIANSEMKDAIKVAKEGITFESVLSTVNPVFNNTEIQQIKQALNGKPLKVMSVSRYTDPAFFANEIVKFLEENAKKPFTDPTRVNAIELWTKHDGEPIQKILQACKKYKVAPMVSFSITTLGNTPLEQGVLEYQTLLQLIEKLIKSGDLDPRTTTIRIDPILPGYTNMDSIRNVVNIGKSLGIRKYVTSLVQSYGYLDGTPNDRKVTSGINNALAQVGQTYDWDTYYGRITTGKNQGKINFKPKQQYIDQIGQVLLDIDKDPEISLQTCSFTINGLKSSACLDPLIIERVTGIDVTRPDGTYIRDTSRPECMCYGCHGDKFRWNEKQCFSSCAYCYAAHSGDSNFNYYNNDGTLKDRPLTRVSGQFIGEQQLTNPKDYSLYSGGATGSDTKSGTREVITDQNIVTNYDHNWTRREVENQKDKLFIFTDNTDRDSGRNLIDPDSEYAQKYGKDKHYPTQTQAVIRGLNNAMPISTQRWYHEGAKGKSGRWTDNAFDEFKTTVDAEIEDIKRKWDTGRYKQVVFGRGYVLFNGPISEITEQRVPRIYNYLQQKYQELVDYVKGTTTQVPESVQQEQSTNPKDFRLYSGGATGSDTKWAEIANKYGVGKTVNYRPEHLDLLTPAQTQEVETAYIGSANKLGRKALDANTFAGKLVRRDYLQAKAADSIFAIGHILRPGEKNSKGYTVRSTIPSVDGGTGYAVQMAIDLHKPVHVFDQQYKHWYRFDYDQNTFVAEDIPTLTTKFAGVGTRQINEDGINAIEQIFEKTFGTVQDQPQQTNTINIWYSSNENADLSNFAIRPFNYKGIKFDSVEQGFQFAKVGYSTNNRNNELTGNKILFEKSGSQLRKLGKQVEGLDIKEWEANKHRIIKEMIKASFEQNPKAKQRLLSTGDAVLTHNQERSEWKTEFPRILMEVRNELRQEQITQQQAAKPFDLTSFATFDESELRNDPDIEQMNRDGEQIKKNCKGE